MTTLYVGNLDSNITAEDLREIFEAYGKVQKPRIIPAMNEDKNTYGFVEIDNKEDAQRAVQQLNGAILNEKRMHVKPAITRPSARSERIEKHKSVIQQKKERYQQRNFSMKQGTEIYKKKKNE